MITKIGGHRQILVTRRFVKFSKVPSHRFFGIITGLDANPDGSFSLQCNWTLKNGDRFYYKSFFLSRTAWQIFHDQANAGQGSQPKPPGTQGDWYNYMMRPVYYSKTQY
jgi:hypothetical protein